MIAVSNRPYSVGDFPFLRMFFSPEGRTSLQEVTVKEMHGGLFLKSANDFSPNRVLFFGESELLGVLGYNKYIPNLKRRWYHFWRSGFVKVSVNDDRKDAIWRPDHLGTVMRSCFYQMDNRILFGIKYIVEIAPTCNTEGLCCSPKSMIIYKLPGNCADVWDVNFYSL